MEFGTPSAHVSVILCNQLDIFLYVGTQPLYPRRLSGPIVDIVLPPATFSLLQQQHLSEFGSLSNVRHIEIVLDIHPEVTYVFRFLNFDRTRGRHQLLMVIQNFCFCVPELSQCHRVSQNARTRMPS